jgi:hypothetical protein
VSKPNGGGVGWGCRAGAGRKRGIPNKHTRATVAQARADGLELLLARLLRRMNDDKLDEVYRDQLAAMAAPFCHARLSVVTMPKRPSQMTDAELEQAITVAQEDALRAGIGRGHRPKVVH